jgi:hypothetical protein
MRCLRENDWRRVLLLFEMPDSFFSFVFFFYFDFVRFFAFVSIIGAIFVGYRREPTKQRAVPSQELTKKMGLLRLWNRKRKEENALTSIAIIATSTVIQSLLSPIFFQCCF